jgi:hypothetical protein
MKNKQIQKKIKKSFFAVFAVLILFAAFGVSIAAADTSVAWTKDIGDVTAADMSEDGSVIYAAVGSQVFVYDSAGIQQNVFTVGGNVVKLVCTRDGTRAALYTDGNEVYYIDSGALTWAQSFTAITDIDISNHGSVLIVESNKFHKYMPNGTVEYDSTSGTFDLGVIDPNDEYAIIDNGGSDLKKYIITTTNDYWARIGNTSFNPAFQDYQNLVVLHINQTNAIMLTEEMLGAELWEAINQDIAISNQTLTQINTDQYYKQPSGSTIGWLPATSGTRWSARTGACLWEYDNKLWIGGGLGSSYLADVWYSSDGISWTQATASAGWSPRYQASSWVFDNKMWIGGGEFFYYSGGQIFTTYRDVWYSTDGITWTQATASAGWSQRYIANSWVFDDKMWIGGGHRRTSASSTTYYSDVWYSTDGITWTQATSSPGWSARGGASSWIFDNKMWIGGGLASSGYLTDVWYSSNGIKWTRATSGSVWSGRYYAFSWVLDNKMWIGGGSGGNGYLTDIWYSTNPYIQFPASRDSEIYIFYNYTGDNPQYTQTFSANTDYFNGTYSLHTKPTLSIYTLQTTKTLNGDIISISLSDRGDWIGTATSTYIYHDQITNTGFGTEYNYILGSEGTVYDIATANGASMSVIGQGLITDIYSQTTSRVGTYTAGGAVQYVDIAGKNALWAASGGEDGKVYVFSKDESSNWYLEYSSDSENPVTALKMSARGEFVLAGRVGSLTLYQTNTPTVTPTEFWFTLYAYKDSDSYRNAAVNVSVYSGSQWTGFAQGLTDSAGKYVVQLTAGQNYKFDIGNGEKILIYMASPSVSSQTVSIYSSPISTSIEYNAVWDSASNSIKFNYTDSSAQTEAVTVKIVRTDNWETVYDQTFNNQQSIEEVLPIIDDTTSYKVEFSVRRVAGVTRNTFIVSSSRDVIPIPLDQNIKNILFCGMLFVIAGLFSYLSAYRGPIVVTLVAGFFIYIGWVTIPWEWFVITIAVAIVASMSQRRS